MRTNAAMLRALRVDAVARGDCLTCRARPAKPGCKTCQACLDYKTTKKKRNVARGKCACGRKRVRGLKKCQRCRDRINAKTAAKIARLKAAKLCIACRQPAQEGRNHCAVHLAKNAEKARAKWAREHPRDAFTELCQIVRDAGLTMTLNGEPTTEAEVRAYAAGRVDERIATIGAEP